MGPKRERRRSKNKATWPDRRLEIYSSDSMIDNLARNSSVGMLAEGPEEEIGSRCAGGCGGDMERQEYTGDIWTEIKWHSRAGVSFLCFSICCCGFFQVEVYTPDSLKSRTPRKITFLFPGTTRNKMLMVVLLGCASFDKKDKCLI